VKHLSYSIRTGCVRSCDHGLHYVTYDGVDLAREILQIRPDMPTVLLYRLYEMISEEMAKEISIRAFVMKPLGLQRILLN